MKDLQWFPPIPQAPAVTSFPVAASLIIAAAFGGLLLARGHRFMAMAVWAATLLLALGLLFPAVRTQIFRAAHWLGAGVGRVATLALLWPFYVGVLGTIRLALWAGRIDLLGLRLRSEQPSYWQPAAPERRRARYYGRLFTVEPAHHESHVLAWALAVLGLFLILAGTGELILRSMGF